MKSILLSMLIMLGLTAGAQSVTAISPDHSQQGQQISTSITSSALFMTASSPQGNIQNIILQNASDSTFSIIDSTRVVNANTASAFWSIPANIGIGIYNLIVRTFNLSTFVTTDNTLPNSFAITPAATDTVGIYPGNGQEGTSFYTTINSTGLFIVDGTHQGNIRAIIFKNAVDSIFANPDSNKVINSQYARAYWTLPTGISSGMYDVIVRIYDPSIAATRDYTILSGFRIFYNLISISPNQAYQGQSLSTLITSASMFMTGSSPQGNIQSIILKNATDSVFSISDSINVVDMNTATTFWNIPANIVTGIYTLIVRIYNDIFQTPTTDYTLNNSFTITTATATISGTVYNDLNHNGVKDAGEPGIPGYTIHLAPLGNIAVSDANGDYTLGTVPGTDTITLQQPADDIYAPPVPSSYIINVTSGATTGKDFGMVAERYIVSMTPDTASLNQLISASISTYRVFKNARLTNILLRQSSTSTLIYGNMMSAADSNNATAHFNLYGSPYTGYYDLVVVVLDTPSNTSRTFILDSAIDLHGPIGVITGYAFTDMNSNGIKDAGEPGLAGVYVDISSSSYYSSAVTDSTGFYKFHSVPDGSYTLEDGNPYYSYDCTQNTIVYTTATNYFLTISKDTLPGNNFGSDPSTSPLYDLYIHPTWSGSAPGFQRIYYVRYGNYNYPAVPVTGAVITMQYDPGLIFDSSFVPASSHNAVTHTLTWNVDSVPGTYLGWGFYVAFDVPPADTVNQMLYTFFSITPATNDCNPDNNLMTDISPTTASHDPNEKHSTPYGPVYSGQDSIITYTINFQNTGTASTHFVIVKDTLNPNLDYKTVITTGGSAPFKFENNKGILTFTFDPLALTDSATDVWHSTGFVSFMVKVKTGTPIGTIIRNTAYVFFDYNAPVITNTAVNEVSLPLGLPNMKGEMDVSVYPNPFEESTTVSFSNAMHDKFILTVCDVTGNIVRTMSGSDTQFIVEKGGLAPGVYLYKLTDQNTKLSAKGKISVL